MSRGLTFQRVAEEMAREIFLSLQFDTPDGKNYEIFNPDLTDAEGDWAQRQIVVVLCRYGALASGNEAVLNEKVVRTKPIKQCSINRDMMSDLKEQQSLFCEEDFD